MVYVASTLKPKDGIYFIPDIATENLCKKPFQANILQWKVGDPAGYRYDVALFTGLKASLYGEIPPNMRLRANSPSICGREGNTSCYSVSGRT